MTKKIVIIRFSAIGDVALWLPVVRRALVLNPNAEIVFLTKQSTAFLFENIDRLSVIGINFKKQYNGIWGIYRLAKYLNQLHIIDIVIDGHDVLRTKILSLLLVAKNKFRFDKGRAEKQQFIAGKKIILPHTTQRYCDVLQKAGLLIDNNFAYPNICIAPHDQLIANAFLEKLNKPKLIGIAPFAMHIGKVLDYYKTEKILEALSARNYTILLFGLGSKELEIGKQWQQKYSNIIFTNTCSFAQEIQLMQACECMLTMDSANMHLASLQGINVVSIWGATHADIGFAPLNNNDKYIVEISTTDLPCRPCSVFGNKKCTLSNEPYACLNRIKTTDVLAKIDMIN